MPKCCRAIRPTLTNPHFKDVGLLVPVLSKRTVPSHAVSVIDDTDVLWDTEPIAMLNDVSKVVRLSEPEGLMVAIIGEEG